MAASGLADLGVALGLVLVLEGIALAMMPELLKRRLALLIDQPGERLRRIGLLTALAGLALVWLIRG